MSVIFCQPHVEDQSIFGPLRLLTISSLACAGALWSADALAYTVDNVVDVPRSPGAASCVCLDTMGQCSLRAAVQTANQCYGATTNPQFIDFSVPAASTLIQQRSWPLASALSDALGAALGCALCIRRPRGLALRFHTVITTSARGPCSRGCLVGIMVSQRAPPAPPATP